jgi:anti-sigma regulatory factor (Ser/Thr protein kinase)
LVRTVEVTTIEALFRHEAMPYDSVEDLLAQVSEFLEPGLRRGEVVMVVVEQAKTAAFRNAFGRRVEVSAMDEVAPNPGRLVSLWQQFLERSCAPGDRVWGVGEPVYPGRPPAELVEAQIHERLLDRAFADSPYHLLTVCPYDIDGLSPDVLDEMERSHLYILEGGQTTENPRFRPEDQAIFDGELPAPPIPEDWFTPFTAVGLAGLRRDLAEQARDLGVRSERIPDLLLAVNEIATNSVLYAGGGSLGVWPDDGHMVCEVRDRGYIRDELVGRKRPDPAQERGRGIWITHQVSDLVQLRSGPSGTRVRIMFECPAAA